MSQQADLKDLVDLALGEVSELAPEAALGRRRHAGWHPGHVKVGCVQ